MFRSRTVSELATIATAAICFLPDRGWAQQHDLQNAARSGDLRGAERLLSSGADINGIDEVGSTPLLNAVLSGRREMTELLLARGAHPDVRQRQTQATPLWYAVSQKRVDLVRALVDAGAKADLRYVDDQTTLHLAALKDSAETAEVLSAAHADVNARDAYGRTPLDTAVLHGCRRVVPVLIRKGANVNGVADVSRRGPLHEASIRGYADIASMLIENGADPVLRDSSDQRPLDLALDYGNVSVVAALLHLAGKRPALERSFAEATENAVNRGRTSVARMLIDCGWPVNQRTASGSTYLNDAALKGQTSVVRLLLDRGAKIEARNQNGGTPLHDAAISGSAETITLLLDRGASIDSKDAESGATPLMLAASLGRTEAVALLLKRGANASATDRAGRTALVRAMEIQNPDLVKMLEGVRRPTPQPRSS